MSNQAEEKSAIASTLSLNHNLSDSTYNTSTPVNSINSEATTTSLSSQVNRNIRTLPPALNLQPNKLNTLIISPSSTSSGTPTNLNSKTTEEHPPFDTSNRNLDWLTDQRSRVSPSVSTDKNTKSDISSKMNGNFQSSSSTSNPKLQLPSSSLKAPPNARSSNYTPVSPCFVHSHLDQLATARPRTNTINKLDDNSKSNSNNEEVNEDEFVKLLETAGSVREMSKNLGRARLISHIQSVMIVTKARDNQLISLTRELALWLMKTPRNGKERGLIVYVDNQLSKSKRFDAEGLERDNPELFEPIPRRYSRTSSSVSLAPLSSQSESIPKRMTPLEQLNGDSSLRRKEENEGQLRYWTNEMCSSSPHLFDFVVTLGGDGTVLYVSWLFQKIVPPIIPISLGSLGFLCNFDFPSYATTLNNAIDNGIRVNLRMRFTCTVYRAIETPVGEKKRRAVRSGRTGGIFMNSLTEDCWEAIESGSNTPVGTKSSVPVERPEGESNHSKKGKDKEIKCFSTRAVESFEVLNDLVVDRGPSPYVSLLELFSDEHHLTTVQADGLCIATPTGSTAYSLSAGGSLVHPQIPAILITPICPHTLSFRPMLLPDSIELRICVPRNSRASAWASFDGRGRVELKQGDHIKVTASPYPFPTVCADKQSTDWFNSIARTLKWNEREKQKSFVILEESRKKPRESSEESSSSQSNIGNTFSPQTLKSGLSAHQQQQQHNDSDDEDEDDDEESDQEEEENNSSGEEFDIDDLSSAGNQTSTNSPTVHPFDPILNQSIPSLNQHSSHSTNSFRPPHIRETSSTASSTMGDLIESHSERFIDGIPKPPRLSQRHSSRDRFNHANDTRATPSSAPASFSNGLDEGRNWNGNGVRSFAVVGTDDADTEGESDGTNID